jgi:probable HAF family extracellular repeat protein
LTALALPTPCPAQEHKQKTPRYTVMDLGTLGGTYSVANGISNSGWVSGVSTLAGDTEVHAFAWRNGVMIDLRTLGGPDSNNFFLPNDRGEVPGSSETSTLDPLGQDFCGFGTHLICLPLLWWNGWMIPLPTLAGGYNAGAAGVNDRSEVVGTAENTISDPTCIPPQVRQYEPVVWENGKIQELPNFPGDTIGAAHAVNEKGQITGWSGNCAFTLFHALLWEKGQAIDLGNLGGAMNTQGLAINSQGQVAGYGDTAGDTTYHAFLWQNGVMTDLGTLPGDVASAAVGINSKAQVVGGSVGASGNVRATIWQNGVIADLNTLIAPNSPFLILAGQGINSAGQIAGEALQLSTGQVHAVLMIPAKGEAAAESATPTARSGNTQRPKIAVPEIVRHLLQRRALFGGFRGLVTPR